MYLKTDIQQAIHNWILEHFDAHAESSIESMLYTFKNPTNHTVRVIYKEDSVRVDMRDFEYCDPHIFDSIERFIDVRHTASDIGQQLSKLMSMSRRYTGSQGLNNWKDANFEKAKEVYSKMKDLEDSMKVLFPIK